MLIRKGEETVAILPLRIRRQRRRNDGETTTRSPFRDAKLIDDHLIKNASDRVREETIRSYNGAQRRPAGP